MESKQTGESSSDGEQNKDEKESPSTTPSEKRCRLDTSDQPSTSSQAKDGDVDMSSDEGTQNAENKSTDSKPRKSFSRRNYRKRSNSSDSSSTSSSKSQRRNAEPNGESRPTNNAQESDSSPSRFMVQDSDDSSSDSDSDSNSSSSSSSTSDDQLIIAETDEEASTDSEVSADTEAKIQQALNKPKPKQNLNIVKNLFFRPAGMYFNGHQHVNDHNHFRFLNRLRGSVFAVEKMTLFNKLERHDGCVNCLNFCTSGELLASGSDDLRIIIWDWARKRSLCVANSGHQANVFQVKFLEHGRYANRNSLSLISSARDGEVRLTTFNPSGSSRSRAIIRHNRPVHKLSIPDQCPNEVLTAAEDAQVVRVDLRDKRPDKLLLLRVDGNKVPLYSIASNPRKLEFCVCGRDKYVRIYDKRNLKECARQFCPKNILNHKKSANMNITCSVYNYDGSEILATYSDENIYLFDNEDATPGAFLRTYVGHRNSSTIKGVNFFGPESEFVMSGSDCGNVFMWEKQSESIIQWLKADESGVVNCLEGHPQFPVIATSGLDHDVKLWSPAKVTEDDSIMNIENLKKCIGKNLRPSDDTYFSDLNLSLMEYFMRHFYRRRNMAARQDHSDESNDDTYHYNGDTDDEDEVFRGYNGQSCNTS